MPTFTIDSVRIRSRLDKPKAAQLRKIKREAGEAEANLTAEQLGVSAFKGVGLKYAGEIGEALPHPGIHTMILREPTLAQIVEAEWQTPGWRDNLPPRAGAALGAHITKLLNATIRPLRSSAGSQHIVPTETTANPASRPTLKTFREKILTEMSRFIAEAAIDRIDWRRSANGPLDAQLERAHVIDITRTRAGASLSDDRKIMTLLKDKKFLSELKAAVTQELRRAQKHPRQVTLLPLLALREKQDMKKHFRSTDILVQIGR